MNSYNQHNLGPELVNTGMPSYQDNTLPGQLGYPGIETNMPSQKGSYNPGFMPTQNTLDPNKKTQEDDYPQNDAIKQEIMQKTLDNFQYKNAFELSVSGTIESGDVMGHNY